MANEKSKEFRRVFSNAFGFGMTDNEVLVTFAYNQNPLHTNELSEEVAVIMTHRSMKLLARTLTALVSNWEVQYGEIPLPTEKMDELTKDLAKQFIGTPPSS